MNRYQVTRQETDLDGMPCEHPLCDRFHRAGCPERAPRVEWFILDTATGERAAILGGETWPRKRDAVTALAGFLARNSAVAS